MVTAYLDLLKVVLSGTPLRSNLDCNLVASGPLLLQCMVRC
jgi:hypothetical protein